MINPSQRPLPDNTQHSQQTNIHAPVGFDPTISAGERPKTYALDRAATGTGVIFDYVIMMFMIMMIMMMTMNWSSNNISTYEDIISVW
jgi:hypothetical protein